MLRLMDILTKKKKREILGSDLGMKRAESIHRREMLGIVVVTSSTAKCAGCKSDTAESELVQLNS
jgi:hypothetical protein